MSEDDNRVGYGRPPKNSRFKPGHSGNPQGRRPQFGNFEADLLDELNAEISIRQNGVEKTISKQRAIINALVAAAIGGNMRASGALLAIFARSSPTRVEQDLGSTSDIEDDKLVKRFRRRQIRSGSPAATEKTSEEGSEK